MSYKKPRSTENAPAKPEDFEIGSPESRAAARAMAESSDELPTPGPFSIVFVQPTGEREADGSCGGVDCECKRAVVGGGETVVFFNRLPDESLPAFYARVVSAQPKDGVMRSIVFEPIIRENLPYRLPKFECNPFPD